MALILCCLAATLRAQTPCPDFGSTFVPATVTSAPITLGCTGATDWPVWHLFVPAHHEPGPHVGFTPGNAIALPCVLVAYRCTGFLLLPVVPYHVARMGYVVDQPEHPCVTS